MEPVLLDGIQHLEIKVQAILDEFPKDCKGGMTNPGRLMEASRKAGALWGGESALKLMD
jgi:hypothetical protein